MGSCTKTAGSCMPTGTSAPALPEPLWLITPHNPFSGAPQRRILCGERRGKVAGPMAAHQPPSGLCPDDVGASCAPVFRCRRILRSGPSRLNPYPKKPHISTGSTYTEIERAEIPQSRLILKDHFEENVIMKFEHFFDHFTFFHIILRHHLRKLPKK